MIGIKGMELPISTQKCPFFKRDSHFENGTTIVSGMFCLATGKKICDVDNILPLYSCKRCPHWPLVDLGKEDMSWEELVDECMSFPVDSGEQLIYVEKKDCITYRPFELSTHKIEFGIDNQIVFKYADEEKIIHTDRSFYQMYQIIKSLVGDQK
jgi:hypothetical protein